MATTRSRRSSLNDLRFVSAVALLLAVANQVEGFYCPSGPAVGGRASRCTAISSSRKVPSSRWAAPPAPATASGRRGSGNVLKASTMESRDKEAAPGENNEGDASAQPATPVVAEAAAATSAAAAAASAAMTAVEKQSGEGKQGVVEAATAPPVESRTVQLSRRVQAEGEMANSRAQRMANLSSELKRSFARKEEVENMIAFEVAQLGIKLRQERDIEIARTEDLKELLKEFSETITEKQAEIDKEQDLLAQMEALRSQVEEASIRAPIETAMAKKADVTSIEVMLLEDLVECKEKLAEELKSTASRAETMNGVVAALPAEGDMARLRAYNWQDVQDLQEVLLSSAESMEASDAQVGSLRTRLLDSVAQKREVLGEASSTELVQSSGGARKMTTARAYQASRDLSEQELLDAMAASSKAAAVGVAKSVVAGAESFGNYVRSSEGQDLAASTVLVIGALAGAAASVSKAFQAAKNEFDENSLPAEEMTSFDKMFQSLQRSLKAVQESPAVKAQLAEAASLLTKQAPDVGARVGKGTVEALKGAASNTEVVNPVKEALDSLERFIVSLAALGTKYFTGSRASRFQLPGGDGAEGEGGSGDADEQRRANAKLPSASPPPKSMEELTAQKLATAELRRASSGAAATAAPEVTMPAASATSAPVAPGVSSPPAAPPAAPTAATEAALPVPKEKAAPATGVVSTASAPDVAVAKAEKAASSALNVEKPSASAASEAAPPSPAVGAAATATTVIAEKK